MFVQRKTDKISLIKIINMLFLHDVFNYITWNIYKYL